MTQMWSRDKSVGLQTGPHTYRAGKDQKKETEHFTLIGGRFNKQGNLCTRLSLGSCRTLSRSQWPPTEILKAYMEPLTGLSHAKWSSNCKCQCRTHRRYGFSPWVGKISWTRASQPTPVFLPGESPWIEEPGGYSPRGHKESDMTTWLSTQAQRVGQQAVTSCQWPSLTKSKLQVLYSKCPHPSKLSVIEPSLPLLSLFP